MSMRPFLVLSLLAAPLLAFVHCVATNPNSPKGSIYRIAVSGANWSSNPKVRAALSKLENVAGVKFDCQTATVTMNGERSLTKDAAETALKDAGFGVKTFESGAGLTVAMLQTRADGFKPDQRDAVLGALMKDVKDVSSASISDGGELILVMRVDANTDAAAINTALEPVELKVKGVESSDISIGYQRYSVELSSIGDATKTRNAVAAVDGVLAVTLSAADKKLEVITPEPCSNLEPKLTKALEPLGTKVTKLDTL